MYTLKDLMDQKKAKTRISNAHFLVQRIVTVVLSLYAGVMSILMLIMMAGDYDDPSAPTKYMVKSVAFLVIGLVSALIHWGIMKKRYPNYPQRN